MNFGDLDDNKNQLRPHIVWFGEAVPELYTAIQIVEEADILVVVGTSLAVYPAAGLVNYARPEIPVFVIDPHRPSVIQDNVTFIEEKAGKGIEILVEKLKELIENE